jgi:hypothetical protein
VELKECASLWECILHVTGVEVVVVEQVVSGVD